MLLLYLKILVAAGLLFFLSNIRFVHVWFADNTKNIDRIQSKSSLYRQAPGTSRTDGTKPKKQYRIRSNVSFWERQEQTLQCILGRQHEARAIDKDNFDNSRGIAPLVSVHTSTSRKTSTGSNRQQLSSLQLVFNGRFDRHPKGKGEAKYAEYHRLTNNTIWYCNIDEENGLSEIATMWPVDPDRRLIVMECPMTTTRVYNSLNHSYDITPFLSCGEEHLLPPPLPPRHAHGQRTAACTAVQGHPTLALVPQWVEYHRLLGFDEFIIFVDGKLDDSLQGDTPYYFIHPQVRRYVTLIPFNIYAPFEGKPSFYNQVAIQHNCLELGRQRNISWLAMNDVDEYFQIDATAKSGNQSSPYPFIAFLNDRLQQEEKQGNTSVGGVYTYNWFFGKKGFPEREPDERLRIPLMSDYTQRALKPIIGGEGRRGGDYHRTKLIVRPRHVTYFGVHKITMGGSMLGLNPRDARMVHFKNPTKGPFRDKKEEAVEDTSLKDAFATPLEERLQKLLGLDKIVLTER